MAHYTIEYENIDDKETKRKALKDCLKWLGISEYKDVAKAIRQSKGASKSLIVWSLGMRGIQGYPAEVMVDHYFK